LVGAEVDKLAEVENKLVGAEVDKLAGVGKLVWIDNLVVAELAAENWNV